MSKKKKHNPYNLFFLLGGIISSHNENLSNPINYCSFVFGFFLKVSSLTQNRLLERNFHITRLAIGRRHASRISKQQWKFTQNSQVEVKDLVNLVKQAEIFMSIVYLCALAPLCALLKENIESYLTYPKYLTNENFT